MTVRQRLAVPWNTAMVLLGACALLVGGTTSASSDTDRPAVSLATWTRTGGPANVETQALAIDPVATSIVYRGGPEGVYKSTDGGRTWRKAGALPAPVETLAIDPADPQTIYAGTLGQGIWKSTNGGLSWADTGHVATRDIYALAVDPVDTSTVYAAAEGPLYKTTNGGRTWAKVSHGLPLATLDALAIDPTDPSTVYVGTNNTGGDGFGVYKTTDGGATWLPANAGEMGTLRVLTLAIDPLDPQILYAGTYERLNAQGGVLKTTDGGTTWTRLRSWGSVNTLAVDPVRPTTVYAGTAGLGIFKTGDGGDTWKQTNDGLMDVWVSAIVVDPARTSNLYAGTPDAVFSSARGGATWQLSTALLFGGSIEALATGPSAPATLYAGTSGVRKSTDGGRTWADASEGLSSRFVSALAVDPSDPFTLYAGDTGGGIFKTTNGGVSWKSMNRLPLTPIDVVAVDPSAPSTIYAGGTNGVVKSTNGGRTWFDSSEGLIAYMDVTALLIDPTDPSVVYAGLSYRDGEGQAGVYKSTDGGATWSRASTGFGDPDPIDTSVYGLAFDPRDTAVIYAAAGCGSHSDEVECYLSTVYRTSDAAAHWDDLLTIEDNWMSSIVLDPADPATLFAGTTGYSDRVSQTMDDGQTWAPFTDGLGERTVNALVFDGSGALYAATSDGVFKSQP